MFVVKNPEYDLVNEVVRCFREHQSFKLMMTHYTVIFYEITRDDSGKVKKISFDLAKLP